MIQILEWEAVILAGAACFMVILVSLVWVGVFIWSILDREKIF